MVEPLVVGRADHTISRRQIDPDALKVLYRLRRFDHVAYLVGGGVRDLLLDRHPKDFDIGTSAHPYEVKRIFRNCWIIGRRFRLAHVKFGTKTIEVATFRCLAPEPEAAADETAEQAASGAARGRGPIRRDNTFGTPEEDAFRRDFTINALFYDIATLAVIDYVGGLADLRDGVIRAIGDPNERFVEDPVRMVRAASFAARLGFRLDPAVRRAIARHNGEIANASPARMTEELYKILRSGVAAHTYRSLLELGLLSWIAPEIARGASRALWKSLEALDAYRRRFKSVPGGLTNAVLLGSLATPVQPLDLTPRRRDDADTANGGIALGRLPVARRDVERLRQLLVLQPRLVDSALTPRAQRALLHRGAFDDAMTWLEIHGGDADAHSRWRRLAAGGAPATRRRRRRRPRRRARSAAQQRLGDLDERHDDAGGGQDDQHE